eukprot:SAG11_NODE_244_length_11735_cov_13.768900_3_plen_150_part_00
MVKSYKIDAAAKAARDIPLEPSPTPGGDACAAGVDCDADGAVGPAGEVSMDGGTSVGECEVGNVGVVVGRQAADGGCAGVGWRSRLGSGITRRLQPGSSDPYEVAWRCLEASWQQMACQLRRTDGMRAKWRMQRCVLALRRCGCDCGSR